MGQDGAPPRWTFLTNHGHVLLCLAQSPDLRLRDVALQVGVTERAVQRIVADLEEGGYLTRRRSGRQNEYDIDRAKPLRHPVEGHQRVSALLSLAAGPRTRTVRASRRGGHTAKPATKPAAASKAGEAARTRRRRSGPR